MIILAVVFLHMSGALKHLMFNDDDIFLRIFVPKKAADEPVATDPESRRDS